MKISCYNQPKSIIMMEELWCIKMMIPSRNYEKKKNSDFFSFSSNVANPSYLVLPNREEGWPEKPRGLLYWPEREKRTLLCSTSL